MSLRTIVASAAAATLCIAAAGAANAAAVIYSADLLGSNEVTPNASPATGHARVSIDTVANTLTVHVTFSGLEAGDTASHIHCCTAVPGTGAAGVATSVPTFTDFPTGVTAGHYLHTFDLTQASSWNPAFIAANGGTTAGAESALAAGLAGDEAYLNIHSTLFPAGEIRGFLTPGVPEPATWAMLIGGLGLAGASLRRRRAPVG
jgi:hypothetical protein